MQGKDLHGERDEMLKQINVPDNDKIKDFIEMEAVSLLILLRNCIKALDYKPMFDIWVIAGCFAMYMIK